MNSFLHAAIGSIEELKKIVLANEKSPRRLDSLVDDLHGVAIRYLRGNHCSGAGCRADAPALPKIETEVFCSTSCRGSVMAENIETEQRVQEAMAQYEGESDVGN